MMALCLYSIRFFGYSIVGKPVSLFSLFEALKPFCTTLLLISAMTFVKDVSPLSTAATIEGIFGAAYFGVGRGLGGFVGGFSTKDLGFVQTFQILAIFSLTISAVHVVISAVDMRRKSGKYVLQEYAINKGKDNGQRQNNVNEGASCCHYVQTVSHTLHIIT